MADLKDDEIVSQLYDSEDEDLSGAITEYIDSISDSKYKEELSDMVEDKNLLKGLATAISEMALLLSSAAVLREDEDYQKLKKKILFSSRQDNDHIKKLRMHYLNNRDTIDIESILDTEEEKVEYNDRMEEFITDYKVQHGII